ncbi:MAG: hypothetical protein V4577_07295 [Bacteroidota bacterium]
MEKIKKVRSIAVAIIIVMFCAYMIKGFLTLSEKKDKNPIITVASIPDEYTELFKDVNLLKLKSSYIFKNRNPITVLTYKDYTITITRVTSNSELSPNFLKMEKQRISASNQGAYIPFDENSLSVNYNLESDKDVSIVKLNFDDALTLTSSVNNFFIFTVSLGKFSIVLDNKNLKEIYCSNTSISNKLTLANLLFLKKDSNVYIIFISGRLGTVLSKDELSNLFTGISS